MSRICTKKGNAGKSRFHKLDHESKMRLLKPTPTPLNGLAMKPGTTRRKVTKGNEDATIRQTTRHEPAAYRQCHGGGRHKLGAMARQTTVTTFPRTVSVAGGRDEERRIEEHRREDKGNQSQNPPAGYHRGGGGSRQTAKTNTKRKGGTTHSPARGGECLAGNA